MKLRLCISGIGFAAPGLDSYAALRAHLSGAPWEDVPEWTPRCARLPARQAKRLSENIRLAIMCAEQIEDTVPEGAPWVFASSSGEGQTLAVILSALAVEPVMIQPLRFQNSVHNAAQGQWSILAGARGPATSIAAYDASAGAGFLKAAMHCAAEGVAVGLVVFDAPLLPPLAEKRPMSMPMAVALAVTPEPTAHTRAAFDVEVRSGAEATGSDCSTIDRALTDSGNPVRVLLPLIERIELRSSVPVTLALSGGSGIDLRLADVG